jgi:hypothetical protein
MERIGLILFSTAYGASIPDALIGPGSLGDSNRVTDRRSGGEQLQGNCERLYAPASTQMIIEES